MPPPLENGWFIHGNADLYQWNADEGHLQVTWDSSQSNSFFHYPLPNTLHLHDTLILDFDLTLQNIQTGTTPEKPSTFEIALGWIHRNDLVQGPFHRGAGVAPGVGPRNLLEFNFFPDTEVITPTVSLTAVSESNQFVLNQHFPFAWTLGIPYHVQLTLQNRVLSGVVQSSEVELQLPAVSFPETFTGFTLDAFAVLNYSDDGQSPPQFAGSVQGVGILDNVHLQWSPSTSPLLTQSLTADRELLLQWHGRLDEDYEIQTSSDLNNWTTIPIFLKGLGEPLRRWIPLDYFNQDSHFFRIQSTSPSEP